jgi:preprotein translocase subunit SecE
MDKTNAKILTLSFAATAALVAFTLHLLIKVFAGAFGIIARAADNDLVRHGVPVVTGLVIFAVLQFNPRIMSWGEDVVAEIRKTVFPSRKETTSMTIVCVIMVLISSAIISIFDLLSAFSINHVLR